MCQPNRILLKLLKTNISLQFPVLNLTIENILLHDNRNVIYYVELICTGKQHSYKFMLKITKCIIIFLAVRTNCYIKIEYCCTNKSMLNRKQEIIGVLQLSIWYLEIFMIKCMNNNFLNRIFMYRFCYINFE